ncbi:MAG: Lrp/AsnC ligand binding domain-containing protein [Nitrososphaerota archaeon]|nr:Lrp/AsnC ligand binding domain-containing protein [Candidatus Bathyarchaeota archaeon]MDW8048391.1 Lrp/AsnC ligand binding domain-containing protein [Nitrososphaerota archaeon]
MQVNVYIFIQVEKGEPWQVAKEVSRIEGVKTAHTVTGQYDVIVFAELESLDALKDLVKSIHQIEGVQHTQTAVCIP